jgi:phosphoadenosine phosphosulfate reductase
MELEQIKRLSREFADKSPQEVLKWTLDNLHPNIALASSFGAEDVVIIDMMMKINPEARVFTLDTGRLNQETYDVMDQIKEKYGINIEIMFPDRNEVEQMVRTHGMNLFYKSMDNRKLCCGLRKVSPLNRALATLQGWITGLRSDQTQNRADSNKIEIDAQHGGIVKVNPIIDWTWEQVLNHIKVNDVPYNKLHDQGYPSIGCEPCTRAIKPGEDLRAGRWWWETDPQKECGLHADHGSNEVSKQGVRPEYGNLSSVEIKEG